MSFSIIIYIESASVVDGLEDGPILYHIELRTAAHTCVFHRGEFLL